VVFIAGVEEGLLPLDEELEEERSLFYVGMTRAKEQLILLSAKSRTGRPRKPSRFLREIPKQLLEDEEISPKPRSRQLSLF
jgi:DNA helicase-2/ATP-dependent DNA helicase PcrA